MGGLLSLTFRIVAPFFVQHAIDRKRGARARKNVRKGEDSVKTLAKNCLKNVRPPEKRPKIEGFLLKIVIFCLKSAFFRDLQKIVGFLTKIIAFPAKNRVFWR